MRRLPRYCIALIGVLIASMIGVGVAYAASNDENGFVSRINGERSSRGLGTLRWNEDLAQVARRHSRRMADQDNLHHNPNLRNEVSGWDIVGENVGYGPGVDELHRAFMDSASHRANVLDRDYTLVGSGTVWKDGTLWVTEVFMRPTRSSGSASAPARARTPSRPASRPKASPAIPVRRPVTVKAAAVRAAPPSNSQAASALTRFMVENLLGGDDPAAGSIHAVDLFVAPVNISDDSWVGVSFRPFARLAGRVNRDLIERTAAGR